MSVDIARVRGLYPTLATRTAQLEGGFAALAPESVIRAVTSALRSDPAQPGSTSRRSQQSAARVARARDAVADLVGGVPDDVVLASSVGSLVLRFATLLSETWRLGDEVVLNRLDSDVVVRAWSRLARARGAVVRWAEVDLDTGEVPTWQYEELIGPRTRVVTVAMGNPATGAVPDVRAIADLAHRHRALVALDVGMAAPYVPLDLAALGADLTAVAAPSFGGPTVAAVVARPGLFEQLRGRGDQTVAPEQFEVPPLPIELLEGFTAAVDHLADLDETATGTRRERLRRSVAAAGTHARGLWANLDEGLRAVPKLALLGGPDRALPVAALTVEGWRPEDVGRFLAQRDVSVWTGPVGMSEVLHAFGADEIGGAAFLGVMPYTRRSDVDRLLAALTELVAG